MTAYLKLLGSHNHLLPGDLDRLKNKYPQLNESSSAFCQVLLGVSLLQTLTKMPTSAAGAVQEEATFQAIVNALYHTVTFNRVIVETAIEVLGKKAAPPICVQKVRNAFDWGPVCRSFFGPRPFDSALQTLRSL